MGCHYAYEHRHGWYCGVTGNKCVFMVPDLSMCSEMYGDEPDALCQAGDNNEEDFY